MKEIPDNEFDRIFREKSDNFDFEFEEDAWLLMEQKLRKKDRIIYLRNFSIAAVLLLFLGIGLYFLTANNTPVLTAKKNIKDSVSSSLSAANTHTNPAHDEMLVDQKKEKGLLFSKEKVEEHAAEWAVNKPIKEENFSRADLRKQQFSEKRKLQISKASNSSENKVPENSNVLSSNAIVKDSSNMVSNVYAKSASDSSSVIPGKDEKPLATVKQTDKESVKNGFINIDKPAISFTFSAGPDFSAINSLAGKKGKVNLGLLLNAEFKRFTLSTGARYGIKKYDAQAYEYASINSSRAALISNIDASCNVLEVPLQISFPMNKSNKHLIEITTGLSSYFMLKEKYLFMYTPESGIKNFLLKKTNENQSYFGVINLSASYKFKPVNKHIRLGIEPYVKLPLGGVGEGKVKLKSSGIALTTTYGITKKH